MKCPQCESEVEASADACFTCGHVLRAQTQALRKGSLIAGRYEILAPLGKGGMGMVYKARDHKLEETVAIKVLRPEVAADADMERRFRTEIRLARRVRHRNVCGIHEYGEDGTLRYIAMEYVEGTDLRKILGERGALPVDQALEVCFRVAEGLQAIHDAGIIHRDLKTANLMVDANGVVRLMDFGIAKQAGSDATLGATATGLIIGTPEYMSPEQARGEKIDFRSDIYSLGILSYELFTGHVPFRGDTPIATIFKHLQEPPPLDGETVKGLPVAILDVLRVALSKKADERYASATEFAQAVVRARDAAGIAPPASSVMPRPSQLSAAGPLTPSGGLMPGGTPLPASARSTPTPHAPSLSSLATVPRASTPAPATPRPPTPSPARSPKAPPTLQPAAPATVMARSPGADAPPTKVMPGTAPAARPRRSPTLLLGVGLSLAAAAAGAYLWLRRPHPGGEVTPVTTLTAQGPANPPASARPPAAGSHGTLVVDALPWGEVVAITNSDGERQPLGSAARYTPFAVELGPGEYAVEVRHPSFQRSVTLRAKVRASAVENQVAEFRRVEAADYFRRVGLQP